MLPPLSPPQPGVPPLPGSAIVEVVPASVPGWTILKYGPVGEVLPLMAAPADVPVPDLDAVIAATVADFFNDTAWVPDLGETST